MKKDDQSKFIDLVSEYKKGNINKKSAIYGLSELSGLSEEIVNTFLNNISRENILKIKKKTSP